MNRDDTSKLEARIKELEHQNEQLQKSLHESEERSRITLNSIGDAVISTDKKGKIVHMNPVAQKVTGWDVEDAKGKAFEEVFNIFNARTGEKAVNPINKVLEKGTVEGLANHTKLISKDGNEYQIADSAAPIKDDQGCIHGVIAVFRDETEEYKKNQQIKENKDFLETTFQSIQDGISVLNTDLSISYVNHVMESWYAGNMPLIGKKCYKAYHDSSVTCDPCPSLRCMKTKKTETEIIPGYPDPKSPVKWLELYSYPIIDSDSGEVKGVVEFVRDITRKEEAERELKRHKDLLAKSQEIAHVGSWELDLTQNRLIWSDEVYRIFGLEPQEFEATYEAFLNRVHPDDREAVSGAYEGSIIDGRGHYEIEHRIIRKKNGEIRHVYERCEHVRDETGKVITSLGMIQDITAERKSEENFRELFENAPIGVFRTNTKGKPLMANKTMTNILGFETPEEVIEYYDNLAEQLYVDPQRRREFLQIMKDQGWVENFEYEAKRKDGKHIWLSMTAKFSNEKDDNDYVIDGFTSDITRRKETEKQLEKRENFISALLNNLNVGVVACDVKGILTYFNKKSREFHGLPLENLPPEEWANYYDLYTKNGQTRMNTDEVPLYRALKGEYFNEIEMVIKPKEGNAFSILNSGQPLKDARGNITGAVVAMHDITERKQSEYKLQKKYEELETTEEELRASNEELLDINDRLENQKTELKKAKEKIERSEERYQNFLAHSSEGIYRFELKNPVDIDMEIEAQIDLIYEESYLAECNNKFVEMYGASSVQDVLGLSLTELHGGKDNSKNRKEIQDFIEQDYRITNRVTVEATRTGETVYFSNNTIGILENKKLVRMWGVQADVTQQKIMEQNLVASKEKAEESDRLKSAFLANMSHEIRTPMNGILGFSQILQESDYPKDQQKKFLGIIHSRTQQLLNIINDILDISKIEANQLTLNFQHFNLHDLMQELYTTYKNQLEKDEKTQIQLKKDFSLNYQGSYIESDVQRLRQIMDNLLNNAIKFTDEGIIEFGYNLKDEGTLVFFVKDTGIGIPSDKKDQVFERFRQVDDSSNRAYEGTGLGLTITKSLVELLGGEMWIDSTEGEGSVFYFTLPYKAQNTAKKEETEKNEAEYNWQDKTVLVVEDDPTSLEYLKEVIEPKGAELILKQTGEEGYQAFRDNTDIDLILMDIRLPDISGMEIIKRIRETNNEVKIIAQTAYAMGEDRKLCLQAGADDYIAKPIKISDLLSIINKYV